MTALKPYPEYVKRDQDWIGDLPRNWEIVPSKGLFGLRKEPEWPSDPHLTPSQKYGVMTQQAYMELTGAKVVLTLVGSTRMKHVEHDDFIIHLRSFQGGIEWSGVRGKVSPAYTVLWPKSTAYPGYYRYVLKNRGYVERIASLTDQLRDGQSMNYSDFGKSFLPCPPLDEQRAIASFLDHETAEIDAFIADQQELIGLLNERRAATITQAVTKGLDPNVPMKDSGVEWLGDVPKHWSVRSTKNAGAIALGKMLTSSASGEVDVEAPYLRAANVQPAGRLNLEDRKTMWFTPKEVERLTLDAGDVVLVEGGVGGYGRAAYIANGLTGWGFQNSIVRIRPFSGIDGRFLTYAFLHLRHCGYIEMTSSVASMPHFTAEKVQSTVIAWPNGVEQAEIADYLDRETAEIDAAVADAKQAIELSKERRAALISAAVTGKIDVRDHPAAKGAV